MADYILDVVKETSKLDWAFAFQRTGAFPLDRSSLFSSIEDAQAYALGGGTDERKLGGTSYVGQPISVYDAESNSVTLYIIDTNRSLKEVGSTTPGDGISIEVVDGQLQLKDFGLGYYAFIPAKKNEEGNVITESSYEYVEGFKAGLEPRVVLRDDQLVIGWYEPSNETAADVAAGVEALSQRVDSVEKDLESIDQELEGISETLGDIQESLDTKANANDVYTKTETDGAIKAAIDELDHLKRTTVAGIESIDVTKDDADQYIYMVPNAETGNYDEYMVIDGELEKVGDWSVDLTGYAKTEDLEDKVDKEANKRLMSDDEGEKLAGIENNAEKNFINSVSEELEVDSDRKLSVKEIAKEKVTGLVDDLEALDESIKTVQEDLDDKVDKQENARLMTDAEGEKLNSIKDLIKSVNSTNFTVTDGQLNLNDISISKITNLQDTLNGKVDRIYNEDGTEWTLLSPENQAKLAALVLNGENVEISGTVNADNVEGLASWITSHASTVKGLSEQNFTMQYLLKLAEIEDGAQVNFINSVDTNQMSVTNGHLSITKVNVATVDGLQSLLDGKASVESVSGFNSRITNLQNTLNAFIPEVNERLDDLDARLTWQKIGN